MEKNHPGVAKAALSVLKTVIAVVIVTIVLLLILAFLLYKLKFSDKIVLIGIGIIYFVANFVGGFIIGKVKEQRRFIWGIAVGVTYFFILGIVSFLITQTFFNNGVPGIIALGCCVGGGALGGMIS